jgi:hypothetical protein
MIQSVLCLALCPQGAAIKDGAVLFNWVSGYKTVFLPIPVHPNLYFTFLSTFKGNPLICCKQTKNLFLSLFTLVLSLSSHFSKHPLSALCIPGTGNTTMCKYNPYLRGATHRAEEMDKNIKSLQNGRIRAVLETCSQCPGNMGLGH